MLRQVQVRLISSSTARCMCTSATTVKDATSTNNKEAYIKQMAANQNESATQERPANWDTAKSYSEIPGPKSIPIFGNIWRFLPVIGKYYGMDQITQHKSFNDEFGKIVKLDGIKLRNDIVILFDPNDIEKMYRNEGIWPHREGLESLIYYRMKVRDDVFQGQGGVLTAHGEGWYNTRSVVNPPMMQPRSAKLYLGQMDSVAQDFMERIKTLEQQHPNNEMPEDFSNELNKWALESICVIGLNKRLGLLDTSLSPTSEGQKFINNVILMFDLLNELDVKPSLWRWFSTSDWKKYVKTLNEITAFELKHINEAMEKLEAEHKNSDTKKSLSEMSILEQLLLKDKKIAFAMVFDMLVAGIDTTSRTSAAALYYLATNPDAQKKLQAECKKVLPNKDTPITADILNNMPYLKATIKETTRLAPIAIGNVRRTPKDLVFGGYQIPKGTDLVASHMYLCRDEKYFHRAQEFIPDRWLRKGGEEFQSKEAHPFVFMPFGFGPRSCIGRRLAQLEIEVLLAKVLRNFSISWPHKEMKWIMNILYGVGSPLKYKMQSLKD